MSQKRKSSLKIRRKSGCQRANVWQIARTNKDFYHSQISPLKKNQKYLRFSSAKFSCKNVPSKQIWRMNNHIQRTLPQLAEESKKPGNAISK